MTKHLRPCVFFALDFSFNSDKKEIHKCGEVRGDKFDFFYVI